MTLWEPVAVGRALARNRLVFGPHETNLGRGRSFSPQHTAYYARRAEGGCGVIVTETASVVANDWPYERAPLASQAAAGWAEIAQALHGRGALAIASLGHAGLQGSSAYSQEALWAPSRFADPASREIPMEMGAAEIAAVVRGFADAAAAAVGAGMDGVELEAGPASLLRQFLSGLTNTRSDGYGEDRARLAREVVAAVRGAVGDAVVGLRLSCDEQAPWAGITPEAAPGIAAGLVDGVDYVVAVRAGPFDANAHRPDGHTEPAFALPLAVALRDALPPEVLVVAQGSIVDLELAESAAGSVDLVEMTRAQIADPDLAVKAQDGRAAEIRPCVLCNQACLVRDARNPIVSCVGEPASGHETTELPPVTGSVDAPLDVLVVGGGVGGLEGARVAALRGHRVRLADAADRPGGAVVAAAAGAGRSRLDLLPRWLASECERLGVVASFGHEVEDDEVAQVVGAGGRVLVASGGEPSPPPWLDRCTLPLLAARTVLTAVRLGTIDTLPAGPIVVDDPVGGPVGVSVAETLAAQGRSVTLVTQDNVAGVQLSRSGDLAAANARLARAGVAIARRSLVRSADTDGVVVEDRFTGEQTVVPAGLVVYAGHDLPHLPLRSGDRVLVAGDAVAPRTILEAVLEGRRAMAALLALPSTLISVAAPRPAGQVTDAAAPVDQAMT